MIVDYQSWHSRLYRFWYRTKWGYEPSSGQTTNLCPYMRTVLFYWWMRWLFISGQIKRFPIWIVSYLFLLVEIPRWVGMISYTGKVVILGAYLIVAIGAGVLLVAAGGVASTELLQRRGYFRPIEKTAVRTASFFEMLWTWLHGKICPTIEFTEAPHDRQA